MKIGEELDGYLHCSPCLLKEEVLQSVRAFMEDENRESFFLFDINERNYRAQRTEKKPGVTCRPITDNKFYT